MKKNCFVLLFTILSALTVFSQKNADPESYPLIRVFLKDTCSLGENSRFAIQGAAVDDTHVDLLSILNNEMLLYYSKLRSEKIEFDTVFNERDLQHIREVYEKNKGIVPVWSEKNLRKNKITPHDNTISKKKKALNVFHYKASYPLFSTDRQHALIYIESACEGRCGRGNVYVFSRKSGNWQILSEINLWTN